VVFLPRYDEDDRGFGAESIGYFFGYAQLTDTRIVALLGDPAADAYELLFSFSSNENKRRFLELMNSNEFTETEDELLTVPSLDEIRDARPLGMVLDEDIMGHATMIAMALMVEDESETVN
jgi:hypothetical protein